MRADAATETARRTENNASSASSSRNEMLASPKNGSRPRSTTGLGFAPPAQSSPVSAHLALRRCERGSKDAVPCPHCVRKVEPPGEDIGPESKSFRHTRAGGCDRSFGQSRLLFGDHSNGFPLAHGSRIKRKHP